jgi:RNA polymerase primary sigma factor
VADSLTQFLNDAGRIPLLTPEEEIHLGRRIQAMIALPPPPHDRDQQIILKRGRRAMDRMVSANIKLVASAARKYRGIGSKGTLQLDLEDLVQEGTIGLMRAAQKFDPERGYKFSTYAYWWIRQFMFRAITQKGRLIKVPHQIAETMHRSIGKLAQLEQSLGRTPTIDEAAAVFKMKPDDFAYAWMMTATRPASLDQSLVDDGADWIEMFGTGSADEQLADVDRSMKIDRLLEHVQNLPADQREAITKLYGLDGNEPLNLTQIGKARGVTRETIRQKVVRAERILKHRMAVA